MQSSSHDGTVDPVALLDRLPEIGAAATDRGADFLTIRRMTEILELPTGGLEDLRRNIRPDRFPQYRPPLWAVHDAVRNTLWQVRET